jgi:hypothetical protein
MSHPAALNPLADCLLEIFDCALRAARDGRVTLDERQVAFLEAGRARILGGLRGPEAEQLLAETTAIFAVKLSRLEAIR